MGDIVGHHPARAGRDHPLAAAGVLVVQGGPGTGKTAVALHRAAYLLYTHRFPLERQGVLVVGPNPLFLRYIEQVLPSLGETGVSLSTVSGPRARGPGARGRRSGRGHAQGRRAHGQGAGPGRAHPAAAPAPRRRRALRRGRAPAARPTTEEIVAQARRRPGTHNAPPALRRAQVLRALADDYRARLARRRRRTASARTAPTPGGAERPGPAAAPRRPRWPRRSTACGRGSRPTSWCTTCSAPGRCWRPPARGSSAATRCSASTAPAARRSTPCRGRRATPPSSTRPAPCSARAGAARPNRSGSSGRRRARARGRVLAPGPGASRPCRRPRPVDRRSTRRSAPSATSWSTRSRTSPRCSCACWRAARSRAP